jgi:outer membrane biosynthesis protein TonB
MSRRGVVIVPPTQRGPGRFVNAACDVDGGTDDRYPEASMRWAVMVLVLVLVGVAGAEDDDAVLETPSLGEPIPERMQTLEKEWDEDVGTNDHAPAPADETDPFERNAAPADEPYVEDEAKPAPPTDEPPEPPKRASTLEEPLARDPPEKPTAIPTARSSAKAPPETSAEHRAADLKDAN